MTLSETTAAVCPCVCVCTLTFGHYILNTHMFSVIAMNDSVCRAGRSGGKPRSLRRTLFHGQTMRKKINHNLLKVCVRVPVRQLTAYRRRRLPGDGFYSKPNKILHQAFQSSPRGLLKEISTPHIPDPGSVQSWECLALPLSCYSTD